MLSMTFGHGKPISQQAEKSSDRASSLTTQTENNIKTMKKILGCLSRFETLISPFGTLSSPDMRKKKKHFKPDGLKSLAKHLMKM